ncbi:MAG TPA: quinol:electron acceptor oxidoreductase subunit ActD [Blastocatellia bacterium]|nr:quinol:electron acceptor oxidoreductase subunit ActD [Blastocatellia bacterium]
MSNKVFVMFKKPGEARGALDDLGRMDFAKSAITVGSEEPLEGFEQCGASGKPTRIGLFATAGGLVGAAAALLLTVTTSRHMGLVTGGMPIVAPWPFGIIVFELTALGAIAFTLGRMIFEAGLMSPVPRALQKAPGVEASVVLEIECPTEARATAAARACQARGGLVTGSAES